MSALRHLGAGAHHVTDHLASVYFRGPGARGDQWARMARVLAHSARRHMPGWSVTVTELPSPPPAAEPASFVANTHKLDEWARITDACADGDRLILIDADCMLLRSLESAYSESDAEILLTRKRNTSRFPINGGVVCLRVGPRSRALMTAWRQRNAEFFADANARAKWLGTYGGINQSALGSLLGDAHDVGFIDCAVYNACYEPLWRTALQRAVVVHYKSALRRALFSGGQPTLAPLVSRWRDEDTDAQRTCTTSG